MTLLITYEATPFEGDWTDWSALDEQLGVEFQLIGRQLYESWFEQCVEYVPAKPRDYEDPAQIATSRGQGKRVDQNAFDPAAVTEPGIHRQVTDDHEHFTIVVPNDIMVRELCERWLEKLNQEYGKDLDLADPPWPSEQS